jgi:hypothetical protein
LTVEGSEALFGLVLALLAALTVTAQVPATDVYVAELTVVDGRARVGPARNATRRPGYDNQPAFLPDGRAFLYTSIRDDGQADIYRYDLATDSSVRVTATAESEYSPTPRLDGGFAVVRVERDSTQRLWRFDAAGHATLVLEHVKPVGYFAFGDAHTVGLFVLGQPPTFQIADTRTGRAETAASNIGRTIQPVPGRRAISFVQRTSDTTAWITVYDLDTRALTPLVGTPAGGDFYAWTPAGAVLVGRGSRLYQWTSGTAWVEIADLAAGGLTSVTRLAVSPRGDRIAIVAVPSSGDAR